MSDIPDTVPIFEGPPQREFGKFCIHSQFRVNEYQRHVTCSACGAPLDPFELLLQQANRQRRVEELGSTARELRTKLQQLYAEEKRVKARVRNAKRKDADAAVAAALAKAEEDHQRTIYSLLGARSAIVDALSRLGHEDKKPWESEP